MFTQWNIGFYEEYAKYQRQFVGIIICMYKLSYMYVLNY